MKEEKKLSVDEYIDSYNKNSLGGKKAKYYLGLITALIGLAIAAVLFFVVLRLFDIHKYAGYIGIGASILLFILLFIVPVCKINKTKAFDINIRGKNLVSVKRYNKALRKEIAANMVDLYNNADVELWYKSENMQALKKALNKNSDKEIKSTLSTIYNQDVKKASNKIITTSALKVFSITAISQSEKLDTLFVVASEIDLIKNIVLLYGYRPSDEKLLKILKSVFYSALLSYGSQSLSKSLFTGVGKKIVKSTSSIAVLGGAIETVLGSTVDGLANLAFTVKVGIETKKYLMKEFHLQDVLDNLESEEDIIKEETKLIEDAKKETAKVNKTNK